MSFDFHLIALDTFGGKLVLVAPSAVDVMLLMWYYLKDTNWILGPQYPKKWISKQKFVDLDLDLGIWTWDSRHGELIPLGLKTGDQSEFSTFGMKLFVPIGFLQVQHTKHFSCHCLLLYSIFFIPAWQISDKSNFWWFLAMLVALHFTHVNWSLSR